MPQPHERLFTCTVCGFSGQGQEFHNHIYTGDDNAHKDAREKAEISKTCLCGGHISTYAFNRGDSWEITCDSCNYLWGED